MGDRRSLYAFTEVALENRVEELKEETASLLLLLKALLLDFSTLHWVGMVEVPSTLVLQHACLPCWRGEHPPSNTDRLTGRPTMRGRKCNFWQPFIHDMSNNCFLL